MPVQIRKNSDIHPQALPGLLHRTLAGPHDGMQKAEVWMQTIAPGAETPLHRHDCEEVIVILSGSGTCLSEDGEAAAFGPNSTLILPPNAPHKITNTGAEPMNLIGVLTMAPVRVETPEGERIPLPWDQDAGKR